MPTLLHTETEIKEKLGFFVKELKMKLRIQTTEGRTSME